jgi:conjugative transfer region protein TrbK
MKTERWFEPDDIGFIALGMAIGAIAVLVAHWGVDSDIASLQSSPVCAASPINPFDNEVSRCRNLAIEGADDPICQKLWSEQRRKFLTPGQAPEGAAKPLEMFPSAPRAQNQGAPTGAPASKGE